MRFRIIQGIIIITYLFGGCDRLSQDQLIQNVRVINLDQDFENYTTLKLSDIALNIEYIVLETTEDSYIGKIDDIRITNDGVFIFDQMLDKFYVFHLDGSFRSLISKKGNNIDEYKYIVDFTVDTIKNSVLLLTSDKYIKEFSYDNRFISALDLEKRPFYIRKHLNGFICGNPFPISQDFDNNTFAFIDKKGVLKKELLNRNRKFGTRKSLIMYSRFYDYHDTTCIWECYYDTIYGVSKDLDIKPRWYFKYNKNYIENKKNIFKHEDLVNGIQNGRTIITSVNELDDYFLLEAIHYKKLKRFIYDKVNGKLLLIKENTWNLSQPGIINNIDGGKPFWPNKMLNSKTAVQIYYPRNFKHFFNLEDSTKYLRQSQREKLIRIANGVNDTDNLIIMIIKFK